MNKFHPGQKIELGQAYGPRSPFEDKGALGFFKPLAKDTNSSVDDQTFDYASIEIREVQSYSELYEQMNFSAKAAAHYGAVEGRASLELANMLEFNETSIIYVFTGVIKFAPENTIGSVELTDAGKKAFDIALKKDPIYALSFFNSAGSEIVTQIRRGSTISVVYSFHSTSKSSRNSLKASLDAKWSSGTANVNLETLLKEVDRGASFTVTAYQYGGVVAEPTILSVIDKEPGNLPEIRSLIQQALRAADRKSSPPIEFSTASVHSLPEILMSPVAYTTFTREIDHALQSNYENILQINRRANMINLLFKIEDATLLKPGSKEDMTRELARLTHLRKSVIKQSGTILAALSIEDFPIEIVTLPEWNPMNWIVESYADAGGWAESRSYGYHQNESGTTTIVHWPIVRFRLPFLISHAILRNHQTEVAFLNANDIAEINSRNGSFEGRCSLTWRLTHYAWGGDVSSHERNFLAQHTPTARNERKGDKFSIEVFSYFGSSQKVDLKNAYECL